MRFGSRWPWHGESQMAEDSPDANFRDLQSTEGPLEATQTRIRKLSRKVQGWRVVIRIGAGSAIFVLAANVSFLVWAEKNAVAKEDGVFTMDHGDDCGNTDKIVTATHLIINMLSTLLLGASSFAMQCLGAPTREEVDKAHLQGTWLDIGLLSVRNLRRIDRKRAGIWIILWLSSFPLHLVYNSVIFKTQSAFPNYTSFAAETFTRGSHWDISATVTQTLSSPQENRSIEAIVENAQYIQSNIGNLERLEVSSCVDTVQSPYIPDYINFLFISDAGYEHWGGNNASLYDTYINPVGIVGHPETASRKWGDPKSHPGSFGISLGNLYFEKSGWLYNADYRRSNDSIRLSYCLAEKVMARCSIQVNQTLLIVVIAFNALKVAALFATMILSRTFSPLVTFGDAVGSFLERSDPISSGFGPISAAEISARINKSRMPNSNCSIFHGPHTGYKWKVQSRHWVRVVESKFITMFVVVSLIMWFLALQTFGWRVGEERTATSLSLMSSAALGTYIFPRTYEYSLSAILVLANLPQLLASALYFCFNSLLTSLSTAAEFAAFSTQHKGLRVSLPTGHQRSTYWLQLPYRYGIPLLAVMAVLHWIISQTLFVLQVRIYDVEDTPFAGGPMGTFKSTAYFCGYSKIGLLSLLGIHVTMFAGLIAFCSRKFKANVPLLGGCSLAISAACHLSGEEDAVTTPFNPLMYGVIEPDAWSFMEKRVGFSEKQVGVLENDIVYQ